VYNNRAGNPWTLYIAIAKNLAAAVYNMHEIGQIIGDLNPENILVDPQTGLITMVDTDSYHIMDSNGNVYRCGVGMPEFVAPELQGKHFPSEPLPTFTKKTDEFSLSVLIFALLMNGSHPFACKVISGSSSMFQPQDNLTRGICAYFAESAESGIAVPVYSPGMNTLPLDIQSLFHRSFVEGHKSVDTRPAADEWFHALERLEKNIMACTKDNEHKYYKHAPECPWCDVEKKMQSLSSPIPPSVSKGNSSQSTPPSAPVPPVKKRKAIQWIAIAAALLATVGITLFYVLTGTVTITTHTEGLLFKNGMFLRIIGPNSDENKFRVLIGDNRFKIEYVLPYQTDLGQEEQAVKVTSGMSRTLQFKFKTSDTNEIGMHLVFIPRGEFMMGSPIDEPGRNDNELWHQEVIVDNLFVGKYEVTQREYEEIMGYNPSYFQGNNLPVENLTWYDAIEFCNLLSKSEKLSPVYEIGSSVKAIPGANGYRLPTEAEWEYICRAGTTTPYYTEKDLTTDDANFGGIGTVPGDNGRHNNWNVHDMYGNVREWCWDTYGVYHAGILPGGYFIVLAQGGQDYSGGGGYYYQPPSPSPGPQSPRPVQPVPRYIVRGGSWNESNVLKLRSASRDSDNPREFFNTTGFRVVRSITDTTRAR
jgi:formylglycine-generating enzyme required for sulfatase activity/serine/threonine protein kinase